MSSFTLSVPHPALSLSAHISRPRLAIGLTTGGISLATVPALPSPCTALPTAPIAFPFDAPCRALSFLSATDTLLAATPPCSVLVFDAARPSARPVHSFTLPAHAAGDAAPAASAFASVSAAVFLAGDDAGGMHVLDVRSSSAPAASVLEHGDYVSAIAPVAAFGTDAWLVASGDGTLAAFELRMPPKPRLRLQYACDAFDDDLLSLAVLPKAGLAVAGTLSGALNLYNLRFLDRECESEAAAHVDRFYGHPECVNAVLAYGEDGVVLTASSDGIVRVVDVPSKSLLGVLPYGAAEVNAEAEGRTVRKSKKKRKKEAWPVESMVSIAGLPTPVFALLGHDEFIRLCDGAALVDEDTADEGAGGTEKACVVEEQEDQPHRVENERKTPRGKKKRKKFESAKPKISKDFFNAL